MLEHHIYEYRKGIRDLVLWTIPRGEVKTVTQRLYRNDIAYLVQSVNDEKSNVYFGEPGCIDIVRSFGNKPLNQYTLEEDFMLGIMLGYSRSQQYERYRERKLAGIGAAL